MCAATHRHATAKERNSPLETEPGKTGTTLLRPSALCSRNMSRCDHKVESGNNRTNSPVHCESAATAIRVNRICPSAEISIRHARRVRSALTNTVDAKPMQALVTATLLQKARSDTIPKPIKTPASTIPVHIAPTIASNRRDGFTTVDIAMDMMEIGARSAFILSEENEWHALDFPENERPVGAAKAK